MAYWAGMKDQLVPIDQAGRVVLPKTIREELAIKPGDLLKISVQGISVTLVANQAEPAGFQRKGKALVFVSGGDATFGSEVVEDILNETREKRSGEWPRPQGKRKA